MLFDKFDDAKAEALLLAKRMRRMYVVLGLDGRYLVRPRVSGKMPGTVVLFTTPK